MTYRRYAENDERSGRTRGTTDDSLDRGVPAVRVTEARPAWQVSGSYLEVPGTSARERVALGSRLRSALAETGDAPSASVVFAHPCVTVRVTVEADDELAALRDAEQLIDAASGGSEAGLLADLMVLSGCTRARVQGS